MTASLILSNNDARNTTLDCDSLGIHYQVSSEIGLLTTGKITQIRRWDKRSNQSVRVGIWERHRLQSDKFKFPSGETVPASAFLTRKSFFGKIDWSFVGDDGRRYIWNVRSTDVTLYVSENGGKGAPIATFHPRRVFFGRRNAYLELFPGYERTLDTLVLTFLYVWWKRVQSQRAQRAAASAGAGAGASC